MISTGLIYFCLTLVTPSPGWSDPILVTEEPNSSRPELHLNIDDQGRFHLIWSGYGDESRIGYKAFLADGTTIHPDTMISLDYSHSSLVSRAVMGDSIFVFWRDYSLIYYCICRMSSGEIVTPATYLFSTSTLYPYIRACPDSLGRLHVLYNEGGDVRYAVWTPAPGSGFTVEQNGKIEGADAGGVLLVDGNRVHIVVQDPDYHDYCYLQYDLEGNTTVPLYDFTVGDLFCSRDPRLSLDPDGNLMIVEDLDPDYVLWKIDKNDGTLLVDMKTIVSSSIPDMFLSTKFILEQIPGTGLYYLAWADNGQDRQILFLLMDDEGNAIVDWALAYDYADEDPENLPFISGQANSDGNLYIAYEQIEAEVGYYPTFGWFDYDYVSAVQEETPVELSPEVSFSCNPMSGSVTIHTATIREAVQVYDLNGRLVSTVSIQDGVGSWDGTGSSGERLPSGIYTVVAGYGSMHRLTLLN